MKHTSEMYTVNCGCRSVSECHHNCFTWAKALDACVDSFAQEMKKKLKQKAMEGQSGWDDPEWTTESVLEQLREHIDKGDMVDVANFAMFAWSKSA